MADPDELLSFLCSLRAVRRFSSRAIEESVLYDILSAGRWTGSSKNSQPWHVIVVRDRAALTTLAACGPYAGHLAGAQAAIVLVMQDSHQRFDEGRLAQNLMLAAWAYGIGSCIGSIYPEEHTQRARELLRVPPDRWLHTALSLGYPADARALRLSAERGGLTDVPLGRHELSELVSWERFGAAGAE